MKLNEASMILKETVQQCFGGLEDPRVPHLCAHQLLDIMTLAVFALLAGAEGWVGIETYGKAKEDWLKTFLELPNGIPSHDTIARLFARLDPEALEASFQEWMGMLVGKLGGEIVAIDGKTLRGSYDREEGVKALQMVSAWASEHQLVLGQCPVSSKSNEITAIPVLLKQLDLSRTIVSIDAMGTQTALAEQIQRQKADYILALKENQGKLWGRAKNWFEVWQKDTAIGTYSDYQSCESGHHRVETRQVWQFSATEVFSPEQYAAWSGLQSLVVIRSQRRLWNKTTIETRFFLSSVAADAQAMAGYIRSHWGIENQLHWCLDVLFREDSCRIRSGHAPRNLSLLRRLALNILRQDSSPGSLKMKRYRAGLDNNFLLQILAASVGS
ncbi:ISAs1 family transposase [Lusitaniella coriacea]|uniref:ISAs1 family transposase n=1 Tax=Lusitaniella coriacea TaxID=1983105 RepID=UPI003CED8570